MGSETRTPGIRAGIDKVLEESFGVPSTPTIGIHEATKRMRKAIAEQAIPYARLDISTSPARRGTLFDASGKRVAFPEGDAYERCYIGLVDPEPRTRWAHPAHWAFVPADGDGEVIFAATRLPEHAKSAVQFLPVPEEQ